MPQKETSWRRTFLIIFTGQGFSLLGSFAVNFALVWWLTVESGSASVLAYASLAAFLPQALAGPFAGPFIDRWDRRVTMIVADLAIAATSVALIAIFSAGKPALATVVGFIAARSLGAAFHTPASQAAIPMYVPKDELMRVAGWNFFLMSGVAMAGPILGAFLMGVLPIASVIALDVAGALIAVTSLLLVRIPHPEKPAERTAAGAGFRHEMAEGLHELVGHRGLLALTLTIAATAAVYIPVSALFPLMTRQHFSGDAVAASIVEVAFGAGMLVGSTLLGYIATRVTGARLTSLGILLLGATLVVSGLLPTSAFAVFVAVCVAMGMSAPAFNAPITAMMQAMIHPARLGRVMSLFGTITMLAAPLGLLAAGPLAERTGVAAWFAISGGVLLVIGAYALLSPALRSLDAEAARAAAADAAVAVQATAE